MVYPAFQFGSWEGGRKIKGSMTWVWGHFQYSVIFNPIQNRSPSYFNSFLAFWYSSFYFHSYNLAALYYTWTVTYPQPNVSFYSSIMHMHGVKNKIFMAFSSSRVFNGSHFLGDRKLSPVPSTVAGWGGTHETIIASIVSLADAILCSAHNTLHWTLGHFIINAICLLFHYVQLSSFQNHTELFRTDSYLLPAPSLHTVPWLCTYLLHRDPLI